MSVQYVPITFCPGCGTFDPQEELVDFGIGFNEYWGFTSFHRDEHWVTKCCEAEAEPYPPEPPEQITEHDLPHN